MSSDYPTSKAAKAEWCKEKLEWMEQPNANLIHDRVIFDIYADIRGHAQELCSDAEFAREFFVLERLWYGPDDPWLRNFVKKKLKRLRRVCRRQLTPRGKPGRPETMKDVAKFANIRRNRKKPTIWKQIASEWLKEHPDDPRFKSVAHQTVVRRIYDAHRRHFGDKSNCPT